MASDLANAVRATLRPALTLLGQMRQHTQAPQAGLIEAFPGIAEFALGTCAMPRHPLSGLHQHGHFWEIAVILEGHAEHVLLSSSNAANRGDVIIVPPGGVHGYEDCHELSLINVLFDPGQLALTDAQLAPVTAVVGINNGLGALQPTPSCVHLGSQTLEQVTQALGALSRELNEKEAGFQEAATALFSYVLTLLSRSGRTAQTSSPKSSPLANALAWFRGNLLTHVTVDELARRAHMSRRTLERVFQQEFGTTPLGYLNAQRVAAAQRLLRESDLTVAQVSRRVGIHDPSYFSRLFKKQIGLEPKTYRASVRPRQ